MVSTSGSWCRAGCGTGRTEKLPRRPQHSLCQRLPQCFLRHHHLPLNHPNSSAPSGEHFMMMAETGNCFAPAHHQRRKALVHSVNDTATWSAPGVPALRPGAPHVGTLARQDKMPDWQWVQKRFEKTGVASKARQRLEHLDSGSHRPRKSRKLHGYLLIDELVVRCSTTQQSHISELRKRFEHGVLRGGEIR